MPGAAGWDIFKLHLPIRRTLFDPGTLGNYVAESVTVQGDVYITHEVNYILYGYANGLAYNNRFDRVKYGRASTAVSVWAWKQTHLWNTGRGHMGASIAWALAGWDYATKGTLAAPSDWKLPNATPQPGIPYAGRLGGHVGDPGNHLHDIGF